VKKLCVVNFWEGAFDGDFFEFFFQQALGGFEYTDSPHDADLIVTSVFGNAQYDKRKTIAFIGENIRPSYMGYDYSLSFDYDTYGGRNFRLPLWYARLAWDGFEQKPRRDNMHNHGYEQLIPIRQLTQSRKLDISSKDKFCALIANNPEGLRINLYNSISKYKQVDGYGNMFNNPLRKSKFAILPEYKFCLCPENSVYDGYVTEKLIDAYAGLTVPIYSGTMSVDCDFNEFAFLNYMNTKNMDWLVDTVKIFDENVEHYQYAYEQPLIKEEPKLDDAIQFVRSIVK
jgi:alpha(1,3/1,4) fucosyltransferase